MLDHLIQMHPRYPAMLRVEASIPSQPAPAIYTSSDISLGGLFVMTEAPRPSNSFLLVSVQDQDELVRSWARVAHVIPPRLEVTTPHPPGMGLQFAPLAAEARRRLEGFLDKLGAQQPVLRDLRDAPMADRSEPGLRRYPRYAGGEAVQVRIDDEVELGRLWSQDLSHGGLLIHSAQPLELHQAIQVQLETPGGALSLAAEVVHVAAEVAIDDGVGFGVGLQFRDLDEPRRLALQNYVAGRVPLVKLPYLAAPKPATGPGRSEIDGLLGQIFDGLECGDLTAALGLPPDAEARRIQVRLQELRAQLDAAPPAATAPQRARVRAAVRALVRIEDRLKRRSVTWARTVGEQDPEAEASSSQPPAAPGPAPADVADLQLRGRELLAAGELELAWQVWNQAMGLARGEQELLALLTDDLARVEQLTLYRRLLELIGQIELLEPSCLPEELGPRARQALELLQKVDLLQAGALHTLIVSKTREGTPASQPVPIEPRCRLLRALARCHADAFGVQVARAMVAYDPDAIEPWQYLSEAYQRAGHRALAERANAQLQRLGVKRT